jgi:hypothetical protein
VTPKADGLSRSEVLVLAALLPIELGELQRWWGGRQARLLRNSGRFG